MVKISKYAKYGEYAKTIEILSRLTKNKYKPTPVDKFDRPKQKGETRNTTGILKFFGFNRWEVKYLKGHNEVIPHEICHVIDSISSYKQTSLKKEFREIAESYKDGFIDYEKRKYRMLYPPVIDEILYQTRHAECFARLLNNWAYETGLIDMPPIDISDGDDFATEYYMRNKDIIDKYFNELFAEEIEDLIEEGLVDNFAYESNKLTELTKTNNLSL